MKIIAIPLFGTRVSPRLDCAQNILLVITNNGVAERDETVRILPTNPIEKIRMLNQLGVEIIICGGLTKFYRRMIEKYGISLISNVYGEASEILSQYLKGKLKKTDILERLKK